jgi:predicted RNase H-like HicB family nuclease
MRYAVVIEKTRSNYSAYAPDLPGCVATGRTKALVSRRIREAILAHLRGLREDGMRIPKASAVAGYVDAAIE